MHNTLYDLDILPKPHTGKTCLWDKLNYCRTEGGQSELKKILEPAGLSLKTVQDRQDAIRYICNKVRQVLFPVTENEVYYLQQYLGSNFSIADTNTKLMLAVKSYVKLLSAKTDYLFILSGIKQTLFVIAQMRNVYEQLAGNDLPELLKEILIEMDACLGRLNLSHANTILNGEPNPVMLYATDRELRKDNEATLQKLLATYYRLEALCSLAKANNEMALSFPDIGGTMHIKGLYHPLVQGCVRNDIELDGEHLLLVTGPNMAGKSTFLKSLGILFVFAYAGVGVPATAATIPFLEHIITSNNLEDDTAQGYSYFYTEVRKVKEIASVLNTGETTLVIADELFKGTNIKDAGDCTEIVINGFLKKSNALVVLASHLVETIASFADEKKCRMICFDGIVRSQNEIDFDYQLRQGISATRLGKYIMQREGIPEMLGVDA